MHVLYTPNFSAIYDNGSIRWIKTGETEILRMIYSAVRDCNWGTVEPEIMYENIAQDHTGFRIKVGCKYIKGPIHFEARYTITGKKNHLIVAMNGTALSDFQKNRIGFCILHPIRECAGKTARVIFSDGRNAEFIFPENISAHQPVKNVQSMTWNPTTAVKATLNLLGDVFEMEDQRNWTDASYKTYCTPLELPFPAHLKKGDTVTQEVELLIDAPDTYQTKASDFVFSWDKNLSFDMPSIGTAISSRKQALTQQEIHLLKELPLTHLRVEVNMTQPDCIQDLEKASRESSLLGWPLFVVLYLSDNYTHEYHAFITGCQAADINPQWILPVGQNHLPFIGFNELEPKLRADFPKAMIGTGVNAYFAELNRSRPSMENADFVSFTICPQVHAFDNASLVENLQAQAEAIRSAQKLFIGKPIFVSPVSLKQRFNVVATSEEPEPGPNELPSSVDPRQRLAFTACWTLASLKFLTQAGVALITYYESVGWKGLIQGDQAPSNKKRFPADAHEIFPVYEAIKKLNGYSNVIHSESSHPLVFDGLVVVSEKGIKLFLFNFTSEEIEIRIQPPFTADQINSLVYPNAPVCSKDKLTLKAGDCIEMIL